jgi:N-acetylglucosaminyldiphosphoundecaprenol N-acetyl-beta-D-mannosaminyltransferase
MVETKNPPLVKYLSILGTRVFRTNYELVTSDVCTWAQVAESRTVYAANVHMLMEAYDSPAFQKLINQADMVTPDGMPLVWMLRLKGVKEQTRVYGPTLMLQVLELAETKGIPVGFYGGSPEVLAALIKRLNQSYPALKIQYSYSPPFRSLTDEEDAQMLEQIFQSGVCILFVGLGCPKQEKWMAEHKGKIPAVMLGVGAAFDFHAGIKRQSPPILQKLGLEWFFRLTQEPKRLWRRYLYNNPRFVFLAIADLLGYLHSEVK